MIESLCLSFIALGATQVPPQVAALAKSRIRHQFQQAHPDMSLAFDDTECANKGTYSFTADGLELTADHALWPGKKEYEISELIEGKKVDFPLAPSSTAPFLLKVPEEPKRPGQVLRFLEGAALGAATGGAGGLILSPNQESRTMNGVVFALSGALVGGLASMLWNEF